VVWEQNVRVIVALTAEVERGHIKCHQYWKSGQYGPFQLKMLTEKKVPIDQPSSHNRSKSQHHLPDSPVTSKTSGATSTSPDVSTDTEEDPFIVIRHFTLNHSAFPFQPIREVTQLQYSYWPDFGATSQPTHLLRLIEQCNKLVRSSSSSHIGRQEPEPTGQRPILVHCSAGCGRTGTFCTVDSVIDSLKRVRLGRSTTEPTVHEDSNRSPGHQPLAAWAHDETIDLVAKTVEGFRTQRPSMVQNLRQFVLCYESVLEWVTSGIGSDLLSEQP
jgi:protein tyrosine phosphatase